MGTALFFIPRTDPLIDDTLMFLLQLAILFQDENSLINLIT
jgi:hypothetical protein